MQQVAALAPAHAQRETVVARRGDGLPAGRLGRWQLGLVTRGLALQPALDQALAQGAALARFLGQRPRGTGEQGQQQQAQDTEARATNGMRSPGTVNVGQDAARTGAASGEAILARPEKFLGQRRVCLPLPDFAMREARKTPLAQATEHGPKRIPCAVTSKGKP
jgi:hypothetical protein